MIVLLHKYVFCLASIAWSPVRHRVSGRHDTRALLTFYNEWPQTSASVVKTVIYSHHGNETGGNEAI